MLAVATPRGVKVDEDVVEGRNGGFEVGLVELQYRAINWELRVRTDRRDEYREEENDRYYKNPHRFCYN